MSPSTNDCLDGFGIRSSSCRDSVEAEEPRVRVRLPDEVDREMDWATEGTDVDEQHMPTPATSLL